MVDAGEERIDPADFAECLMCRDSFPHDDLINGQAIGMNGTRICEDCLEDCYIVTHCNSCDQDFASRGIPTSCCRCGSWSIQHDHSSVDRLIHRKQEKEMRRLENLPFETPFALANFYQAAP